MNLKKIQKTKGEYSLIIVTKGVSSLGYLRHSVFSLLGEKRFPFDFLKMFLNF